MDEEKILRKGATLQNGRYTIVGVLGQGGFGITYHATTREKVTGNLGEMEVEVPVAIKEFFMKDTCKRDQMTNSVSLLTSGTTEQVAKYRQKFVKEAHNLANLNHPNIVHVADVFEENNTVYYVMQFLKDGSLRDRLKNKGPLPEQDALRYTIQIAEALEYMHTEKHMCHYDVKPGNILLNGDKPMLIDFGISKNYTSDGRETSATPVGLSKGFAPLEQFQQSLQDFSPVTDIYSLGATLYNLVTGEVPPEASTVNEEGLGPRPENLSEQVWNAIVAAMQPRRKDRPQSMREFIAIMKTPPLPKINVDPLPPVVGGTQLSDDEATRVNMADDEDVVVSRRPDNIGNVPPPPPPFVAAAGNFNGGQQQTGQQQRPPVSEEDEKTVFSGPTPPPITSGGGGSSNVPPTPDKPESPVTPEKPSTSSTQKKVESYNIPPKKKKSKAPLIILAFLLFAIIGGVGGFFAYKMLTSNDDTPTTAVTGSSEGEEPAGETVTDQPIYGSGNAVAFTYTGEVNDKQQPHGKGVAKYTDSQKDTYTGKFQNGLRVDSLGTLIFKNGDKYVGSFVNDQFGEGTYTIAEDGTYFKGTFRDYKPYNGEWFEKNGNKYAKVVNGANK